MIEKPVLSNDFSVEDIRKLRTYTAEIMKNMTRDERIAYPEERSTKLLAEIEKVRAQKNAQTMKEVEI